MVLAHHVTTRPSPASHWLLIYTVHQGWGTKYIHTCRKSKRPMCPSLEENSAESKIITSAGHALWIGESGEKPATEPEPGETE